jgi:hypothetical protein
MDEFVRLKGSAMSLFADSLMSPARQLQSAPKTPGRVAPALSRRVVTPSAVGQSPRSATPAAPAAPPATSAPAPASTAAAAGPAPSPKRLQSLGDGSAALQSRRSFTCSVC